MYSKVERLESWFIFVFSFTLIYLLIKILAFVSSLVLAQGSKRNRILHDWKNIVSN